MEVTVTFNELLRARSASPARGALPDLDRVESYLKEASAINRDIVNLHSELSHIRQAYLSTAAPRKTQLRKGPKDTKPIYLTDADRSAVDKMAKESLQRLNLRIRILEDDEAKRHDAAMRDINRRYGRGLRALAGWAAGGALGQGDEGGAKSPEHAAAIRLEMQLFVHKGTVIGYLKEKLNATTKLQGAMMEARLAREMEKNRSILAKASSSQLPPSLAREFGFDHAGGSGPAPAAPRQPAAGLPLDEEESRRRQDEDLGLTDEQKQMFEKDNQDMLRHYNTALDKVKTVEKSIMEIAELQQMLADNLTVQSAHIDQLVSNAERTEENVGGGNKQLKKATQRKFSQARLTFYAASALCTALVLWDLII